MASRIKATSSTDQIPGYKMIQAIEALYVDGFRTPAEALEGLKAAAAEKGANAVINVHHERSSMGRCAASGDAVVAETTGQVVHAAQPADRDRAAAARVEEEGARPGATRAGR